MNRVVITVTVVASTAMAAWALAASRQPSPEARHAARLARGAYLVEAVGCADCHAPKVLGPRGPVPDLSRGLSGHPEASALPAAPVLPEGPWAAIAAWDLTAWSGPWGTSYAFNLTPDENTGIGSWSEDTFVQTIRTGRHMGVAREILPPMPWEVYRNFSDEDLRSIYAHLMAQPPVHNRVPEPLPPVGVAVAAG